MISLSEDAKKVATSIGKVVVDVANLQFGEAIKNAIDAAGAYRSPDAPPMSAEEAGCVLLQRAAASAAVAVFQRFRDVPLVGDVSLEDMATALSVNPPRLDLDAENLSDPVVWTAVLTLEKIFTGWLEVYRVSQKHRGPMGRAFAEEFPLALRREFIERAEDYQNLVTALNVKTPADDAARRALNWRDYRAKLAGDVAQPMRRIDDKIIPPLSLQAMYVPLRAVWEEKREGERPLKHIRWLDKELLTWAGKPDKDDWARVITGGPGYGKSSACKILAADLARVGRRVLLVPLGRLDYHGKAEDALKHWTMDKLGHDPLEPRLLKNDREPLVLILDGLDELVKAGKVGEQAVQGFVTDLSGMIERRNEEGLRVRLLLAGRPGTVEATARLTRRPGALLEAQKFVIEDHRRENYDDKKLAELDQRDDWWRRFGRDGLPGELTEKDERLDDVTAQPLLNWLLAQVLALETAAGAAGQAITDVHQLYERLLHHVLDRTHRDKASSEAINALKEKALAELLEEVAVAAWHDGDRNVALATIKQRLDGKDYAASLDALCKTDRNLAIHAVLDSFFCAPRDGSGDARVFEFTHKSFREFLTVRRLLREFDDIVADRKARRWLENTLEGWFALCGPTAMTEDLLKSVRDAAAAKDDKILVSWRDMARELLQHTIHYGFDLPKDGKWTTKELDRQARNAEEALLAIHSACALALQDRHPDIQQPLALDWGEDDVGAAGLWVHRMVGAWVARPIAAICLNNCSFYGANLSGSDLFGANLFGANLSGARLFNANLSRANLTRANLLGANLLGANLSDANISDTHLYGATVRYARGLTEEQLAEAIR